MTAESRFETYPRTPIARVRKAISEVPDGVALPAFEGTRLSASGRAFGGLTDPDPGVARQ